MRARLLLSSVLVAVALCTACGHTGFVGLSEPAPPASPAKPLPIYTARDIGRPYQVLGYVFRTTEGHKSGLRAMDEHMYVLTPGSEEMSELRREALARGADAVVALEMFPTLNGFGQPVGFSVGGLAVKFVGTPVATPQPAAQQPAAEQPAAEQPAAEQPAAESGTSDLPDVASKEAPLEEPEPAPSTQPEPPPDPSATPELPAP